jgi:hypothetical protein
MAARAGKPGAAWALLTVSIQKDKAWRHYPCSPPRP